MVNILTNQAGAAAPRARRPPTEKMTARDRAAAAASLAGNETPGVLTGGLLQMKRFYHTGVKIVLHIYTK